MTTLWAIVIGVLSSVVASAIWLAALRGLRPNLEISPVIVQDPAAPSSFRIKIINKSRRAVVDVSFELAVMRPERARGGTVTMRKTVRLAGPPPLIIPGRRRGGDEGMYRIRVNADLRSILERDDRHSIRLRVFGRDEWSGVGAVAQREYHDPTAEIVTGRYAKGPTFDVV
jgi:hypothetical protein